MKGVFNLSEINLNDLMAAKSSSSPPPESAADQNPATEIVNVEKAVEQLSPQDLQKVQSIKESINLLDSSTPLNFGASAQKNLAEFSNSVLTKVRTKDSGEVGNLLTDLVGKVKGFEPSDSKSFFSKIPLLGSLIDKSQNFIQGYEKLSTQVDKISNALEKSKIQLMEDVALFDNLYQKNLEYFKDLQLYIRAGEEKLVELRDVTLPKLRQQANSSNDPMAVQLVSDFEQSVDRFEKKIHDLKLSKTIAIQSAPQIRLIQNNDKLLIDRVQAAIFHTIPLWKNQIVIALGLSKQQAVLQLNQAVSDTTNQLLQRNSQMLKQNSIETAKENERAIVDIDTLKKVNQDLISTIEETIKIQQEGRIKRQNAEKELIAIEDNIKSALLRTRQNG